MTHDSPASVEPSPVRHTHARAPVPGSRRRWSVGCTLLGAALLACAMSDGPPRPGFDARPVELTEELRLGGYDEDFVPINALAVRDDGAIAVAQPQDGQVRFYDADGEWLGAFGREGEGPGEFTSFSELDWMDDSLWVYDRSQRRFTVVSPSLELGRTVTGLPASDFSPPAGDRTSTFPRGSPFALAADGSVLIRFAGEPTATAADPYMGPTTLGRARLDGTIESLALALPPVENGAIPTEGGGILVILPGLMNAERYHVIDPTGEPVGTVTLAERSTIHAAELDRIWVVEHDEFDVPSLVRYAVRWE